MTKGVLRDKSGAVDVVWYHMPYLKNTLKRGAHLVFRGKLTMKKKRLTMEQPSVYEPAEYQALRSVLQPVYPLCEGLTNNMLQKAMHQVMADEELTREYPVSYTHLFEIPVRILDQIRKGIRKLIEKLRRIRENLKKSARKLQNLKEKVQVYLDFYHSEEVQAVLKEVKRYLTLFWKHYLSLIHI